MTRTLNATCAAGVVKVGALPISDAVILSDGVGESAGVLILEQDKQTYIPNSTPDLESTIEKTIAIITDLASVLSTITTSLTSIGAGMTGPTTAPPPTLPTDIATILTKVAALNATKVELTTLKGSLI